MNMTAMSTTIPSRLRQLIRVFILTTVTSLGPVGGSVAATEPPAPVQLSVHKAVRLSFPSKAGESYQLFRSRDGSTWEKYGEVIAGTGQDMVLTHLTEADDLSLFKAETLGGEPVEVVKQIEDFKGYQTWKRVRTLVGPDPALGGAHGEPIRHRSIYVSPADARLVNGELPVGTVLVKELREDVNGLPGAVTDALTVMVKRGGSFNPEGGRWEYFMTDTALTQTMMRGGAETMCAGCHSAAKDSDFAFSATVLGR